MFEDLNKEMSHYRKVGSYNIHKPVTGIATVLSKGKCRLARILKLFGTIVDDNF